MMVKLYKNVEGRVRYHEAWIAEDESTVHEHWGMLGRQGKHTTHEKRSGQSDRDAIEELLTKARQQGFVEIDDEELQTVIVQLRIRGRGTKRELAKRHRIEERLDDLLGWTGHGHVDGGDIGSGTMNVFCLVVDAERAASTVHSGLRKMREWGAGMLIAIRRSDEDEPEVVYPKGYERPFNF